MAKVKKALQKASKKAPVAAKAAKKKKVAAKSAKKSVAAGKKAKNAVSAADDAEDAEVRDFPVDGLDDMDDIPPADIGGDVPFVEDSGDDDGDIPDDDGGDVDAATAGNVLDADKIAAEVERGENRGDDDSENGDAAVF